MSNVPEIRFKGFTDLPAGRQALGNSWFVYVIKCETREIAMAREKYLKSGSGREWLKQQIQL